MRPPPSLHTNRGPQLRLRLNFAMMYPSASASASASASSTAAIGSRRCDGDSPREARSSSSVFSERRREFARKRALYFSTTTASSRNADDDNDNDGRRRIITTINRAADVARMTGHRSRDATRHHRREGSVLLRPGVATTPSAGIRGNGDDGEEEDLPPAHGLAELANRSIVPLSFAMTTGAEQRRWCSSKTGNARAVAAAAAAAASSRSLFATSALFSNASRASSSSSSSSTTSTSATAPKPTAGSAPLADDRDVETRSEPTPSAGGGGDDADGDGDGPTAGGDRESAAAVRKAEPETGWKRVRTIRVPRYGPDADKAARSLQSARKERARVKTSINVQRALCGNMVICAAKLGAWLSSGSSSMMSEFVHSVVDCGNQALLLVGLRHQRIAANQRHPYGYGKSVYFWALVSALGTFFMGAGVSMSHSVQSLFRPALVESISSEIWFVLAMSFVVDGYVLFRTYQDVEAARPRGVPMARYVSKLRDPATLAVLMEDGAACLGIVIAIAGLAASSATGNPVYDGIAGVGISCLLGGIGLALVRVNHSFLIGQAVEKDMLENIERIIRNRRSIDNVTGIQSQWTGPETFSFKAELDFDGTYLSALLMPRYRAEFRSAGDALNEDLEVLLSWYAEDVIRAVEREVRHIESVIRQQYPGAEYIELEPMSKYVDRFAIDDSFEEKLMMIEKKELKKWVSVLYEDKEENAWRIGGDGNVVSGSAPTDTLPEGGSTAGDKPEK